MMSHELRTPLNAINGFSNLLAQGFRLPLAHHTDIEVIAKNAQALLKIVNDILDLAKLDAGKMQLVLKQVSVADILAALRGQWARASEMGPRFDIKATDNVWMLADEQRVLQILNELLDNAFTFTDQGSVCVSVSHDDEFVWFNVQDTGIGIDKKNLLRVFQRFQQVDAGTTRRHGAGLGLALSKDLVKLMGGQLWMESYPGQGTTVHVSFRRAGV